MRAILLTALLGGLCSGLLGPVVRPARAADEPGAAADLAPEEVRKAITQGIGFLKNKQAANGRWGEVIFVTQPGGQSALCTLALLSAGVPASDPGIQRALKYLEGLRNVRATYALALQTLVFCQANPAQYLTRIQDNVRELERSQIKEGPNAGAWSYPGAGGDNSNAQFALLALHEAERAGAVIDADVWKLARRYWEEGQNDDGSWGYHKRISGTGSMTCAGIASLIITSDRFRQPNARVNGDQIQCCLQAEADDSARIDRGLAWLGRNFSVTSNPGSAEQLGDGRGRGLWLLYYLYGMERVGRLTNQRFFYDGKGGRYDWYREGAKHLVASRDTLNGWWKGTGRVEADEEIGTALALLFLAKGRRPVIVSKLQHSVAEDWNQHRSDIDNLVRHVEKRWKRELTWQVTELPKATVEDLLQSPVLFLCGSLNPLPAGRVERQVLAQKLRDYLDRGGFLLAEGYGSGVGFDQGFRELMTMVFPEPEYRLRLIEPQHPIWRAEQPVPPEHVRPLLGIDFGCRTSVIYAPPDPPGQPRPALSCLWELSRPGRDEKFGKAVRDQVEAGLILGVNILAYATNREVAGKEEAFRLAAAKPAGDKAVRGKIYIAKLRHPGWCNAAPRALANLLEAAGENLQLRTAAEARLIDIGDESLFDHHLVFMHGRQSFRLTDAERKRLRTFVERGGMLFADAICTSAAFTESFRSEMTAIFPDRKLERIPADDSIFTPAYGGFDLKKVNRRDPQRGTGPMAATLHKVSPDFEGIRFDDRWGVVFSQYDLSCALERREAMECRGYDRTDAGRLGLNVLLYSLQQ